MYLAKNVISKFQFLKVGSHCEAIIDVTKNIFYWHLKVLICMNFLLELIFLFQVTQRPQNNLIKSFRSFWDTLYWQKRVFFCLNMTLYVSTILFCIVVLCVTSALETKSIKCTKKEGEWQKFVLLENICCTKKIN